MKMSNSHYYLFYQKHKRSQTLKWFFIFYLVFSQIQLSQAQDIQIYVKKGSVTLSEKRLNTGESETLKKNDEIVVSANALVLARKKNSITEIPSGNKYTYTDLEKILQSKKNYTQAFVEVATSQKSIQKSSGVTTRGNTEDPWMYFPQDSIRLLANSITLQAGGPNSRLISDIVLLGPQEKDSLVFEKEKAQITVSNLSPGEYHWKYQVQYASTKRNYLNYFIVPDENEKSRLMKNYKEYEKSLKKFSPEMQEILISEYCLVHKIYIGK